MTTMQRTRQFFLLTTTDTFRSLAHRPVRLQRVSWNGRFYTCAHRYHHPSRHRPWFPAAQRLRYDGRRKLDTARPAVAAQHVAAHRSARYPPGAQSVETPGPTYRSTAWWQLWKRRLPESGSGGGDGDGGRSKSGGGTVMARMSMCTGMRLLQHHPAHVELTPDPAEVCRSETSDGWKKSCGPA